MGKESGESNRKRMRKIQTVMDGSAAKEEKQWIRK